MENKGRTLSLFLSNQTVPPVDFGVLYYWRNKVALQKPNQLGFCGIGREICHKSMVISSFFQSAYPRCPSVLSFYDSIQVWELTTHLSISFYASGKTRIYSHLELPEGIKGTNSMVVTFSVGGNFHRGWTEGEKEEERRGKGVGEEHTEGMSNREIITGVWWP